MIRREVKQTNFFSHFCVVLRLVPRSSAIIVVLLVLFSGLLPFQANASELFFNPDSQEAGVGQEFQIDLMLNTEGKSINALEGTLTFPSLVEIVGVYDGNSIVPLWLEKSVKAGSVDFSGVIPGGFAGILLPYQEDRPEPGKVLSFVFKTQKIGEGNISIDNAQALLNDGRGTPDEIVVKDFKFQISAEAEKVSELKIQADKEPPEPFTPQIIKTPNLFSGQWVLIFVTQDKGSGIDHYEVKEGNKGFVVGQSPYLLSNQELTDKIIVKAVDQAGNERIAILPPQNPLPWYEIWWVWGIIILLVLFFAVVYLLRKNKWLKQ